MYQSSQKHRWISIEINERVIKEAKYMIETRCTIRQLEKIFGMSKTSIHLDLTQRLSKISPELSKSVREILDQNAIEKHRRGGATTRLLFKKVKK